MRPEQDEYTPGGPTGAWNGEAQVTRRQMGGPGPYGGPLTPPPTRETLQRSDVVSWVCGMWVLQNTETIKVAC